MINKSAIECKLESKMTDKFTSSADNPKTAIHLTALAGAGICAVLPIGIDVWALRTAEVIMIICIADLYHEKISKSAARGILASSFAQLVGEHAAIAALAAADTANLLNPALAYCIKAGIAVGLIEAIGHEALKHYEKKYQNPESKEITAFDAMCAAGAAADAARIITSVSSFVIDPYEKAAQVPHTASNAISFTGSREGFSFGHSESYWKDKIVKAIAAGDKSGRDYAEKRLKEAIENRLLSAK